MLVFDWLMKITNIESELFHSWMMNVNATFLKIELCQPCCVEILKMEKRQCVPLGGDEGVGH